MSELFHFKQFSVDQSHCAMKVNTDGVLLGAWASATDPRSILDMGTGTGVIALMLAQRFGEAEIDAVEIDKLAATTTAVNFQASPFANRLKAFPLAIEHYFMVYPDRKFDLIVSNPPFFIDALKSQGKAKETARHADATFFEEMVRLSAAHLHDNGKLCVILPLETAELMLKLAEKQGLYPQEIVNVSSFPASAPHRQLLSFAFQSQDIQSSNLAIYESEKVYHIDYQRLLQNFLTIF